MPNELSRRHSHPLSFISVQSFVPAVFLFFLTTSCILYLLFFPQEALQASKDGLTLWLNTLLPTLLPFLILTGVLLGLPDFFSTPKSLKTLLKTLLGVSPSGFYCLVFGLLCGYPMGAKLTSDFYTHERISRREAHYLLTISCNASPAFLLGYLTSHILQNQIDVTKIVRPLLLADLICMFFFRFLIFRNQTLAEPDPYAHAQTKLSARHKKETPTVSSPGAIIDVSIMNGFETITRLGGYILLFSIISAILRHFWKSTEFSLILCLGCTELITGLNAVTASGYPFRIQYILSMIMTGFGGICILFQTKSVLNRNLSIIPYLSAKIFQTILLILGLSVF